MKPQMLRRTLVTGGPLVFAGCRAVEGAYFGRTEPPQRQRLVCLLGAEPATLDPALSLDRWESYIIHALFEGLTSVHPVTGEPLAALATYYEVSPNGREYAIFLRGHPEPRGLRLPTTDDLPPDFSRGRRAPPKATPARWSDGAPITARDVIDSWRRTLDPTTAATYSYLLHCIANAEQISSGKMHPTELAVRAIDPFQLRIELRGVTPFFLQILSHRVCCVTPRQAIDRFGASWTDPGNIVTNGAFILKERRTNDKVLLGRNPHYYEADVVTLEELEFQIVVDGATTANLYRTGGAAVAQPLLPQLLPALSRKRDFRAYPMFGLVFPLFNTTIPPLNDVRVRYALNMAIDKKAVAHFASAGRMEARGLVPPLDGYASSRDLEVSIDGVAYNVLSYDPRAARELFRKAGHDVNGKLPIQFLLPKLPDAKPVSEILQQQWRHVLGVELIFVTQDLQTWLQTIFTRTFRGIALWGDTAGYIDPTWFLDQFKASSPANPTGWSDLRFEDLLSQAAATADHAARMHKLYEAERQLLRGMPCIPLYTDVWTYLRKPFVQGLGANTLDIQQWKYAWIDTNWKPERS